jgi:hypothetical protein
MEKRLGSWLLTSLGITVFAGAPGPMAMSDLKLTLVIYNYAHVTGETLTNAENRAAEIFRDAGIQLIWRDGFAYAAERQKAEIPQPEDPATLIVKLQPASDAARYGVRLACEGIGLPSGAIVFVRTSDGKDPGSAGAHLGYIIAHELGHILLGPNAHSIVGIMRGTLLQDDWEKAAQGTLDFTRSQKRQIRTWIAERSGSWSASRNR